MSTHNLSIGGFQALSMIDYPGHLAAVVYLQGCPLRCSYCHNPELQDCSKPGIMDWEEILEVLNDRKELIEAVVFSGGEPLLQSGLGKAIDDVKALGLKVGLHTSGVYPHKLSQIIPKLDWVGLDIKALPEDYEALTGLPGVGEKPYSCIHIITVNGIEYQLRTTVHPLNNTPEKREAIEQRILQHVHVPRIWQACQPVNK